MIGGMLIAATHDWRSPFYIFAIPGIILAIIVFFMPDYKSVKQTGEAMLSKAYFKSWGQVFKVKSWWLSTIGAVCAYFMIIPTAAWMPSLLIRGFNMSTSSAGTAFGLIMLVVLLGPLGGILADRWFKRYVNARPMTLVITALMSVVATFVAMLTMGTSLALLLTLIAVSTVMFAVYVPVMLCVQQDVIPVGLRATSGGVWNFIIQITGSSLGPIAVGAISDAVGGGAHGIQMGLMWMVPVAFIGVLACLLMTKYYPSDSAKVVDEVCAEK
jgi:MFS family permease